MQKIYFFLTLLVMLIFCGTLLVDRYILNQNYSRINDVIEKKEESLQKQQQQYKADIQKLNSKLQTQQQQFHIVMPYHSLEDAMDVPGTKAVMGNDPVLTGHNTGNLIQYGGEKELQQLARALADRVKKPVNAVNIVKAFQENPDPRIRNDIFYSMPGRPQQLVNIQAALLEALCIQLGYKFETVLCWDMNTMEHFFQTRLSSPDDPLDRATFSSKSAGKTEDQQNVIILQEKPISVLLPFHPIELNDRDQCVLMSNLHTIPVGGLYLHRIDVNRHPESKAKEWILEYRFNDPAENPSFLPAYAPQYQTKLSGISMIPGGTPVSCLSEGMQTFRIPFVDGKSSVLIVGDLPVLPAGITAYSIVE